MWLADTDSSFPAQLPSLTQKSSALDLLDVVDTNASQDSDDVTVSCEVTSKWSKFTGHKERSAMQSKLAVADVEVELSKSERNKVGIDHLVAISPPKPTFAALQSDNDSCTQSTVKSCDVEEPLLPTKRSRFCPPRNIIGVATNEVDFTTPRVANAYRSPSANNVRFSWFF